MDEISKCKQHKFVLKENGGVLFLWGVPFHPILPTPLVIKKVYLIDSITSENKLLQCKTREGKVIELTP